MAMSMQIITTPTADTPGTVLILRTHAKHYIFGSLSEGTQRAMAQQGARLLKAQDFFLTGKAEWSNTGGLVGLMLTLADASSTSYASALDNRRQAQSRGKPKILPEIEKPHFNVHGPPNLKHTLATCRRFVFRNGLPIVATEYTDHAPQRDEHGAIAPSWQDMNVQVWALAVAPAEVKQDPQAEADLERRRQHFDQRLNAFTEHQAPQHESPTDREARYDRIRTSTINFMFDSTWTFDTLEERHISEVEMPAAMFVRNPDTHGYEPYKGPTNPLPDIKVFTRTPWPGAKVLALPPTKPAPESVSYIVRSHPTRGTFDVARAKALGVKPGPNFGKLTGGQAVLNQDGKLIHPGQVMGPDRPGQGIAILDVPSAEFVEPLIQREELNSRAVMTGIGAIIWMLGPGVVGHPALTEFMSRLDNVQHVISSSDASPNRISNDSVAGQATRLHQVDPARYSTPVHDNITVPQRNLNSVGLVEAVALPEKALVADRGMSFTLMPEFSTNTETTSTLFDAKMIQQMTAPEVVKLAEKAQQAVQGERSAMQSWGQRLARPDTEITTLGTGSALPSKYRNVSSTLVRVPGVGNYLFDCGENTIGQLARVFPLEELVEILKNLRVIWISHLHADHHLGTASVIRAWYQLVHGGQPHTETLDVSGDNINTEKFGLSVISHSGMLQWLREYSAVEDFGYSRILPLEITPNEQRQTSTLSVQSSFGEDQCAATIIPRLHYARIFGFSDIQAARVQHCHGAMAVSITFPRSRSDPKDIAPLKVSYSGDCRPSYHFGKIGENTTVLIHEATFDDELQGDAKAKKHSTTSEALGVAAHMNAKAIVLTHFSQRYQKIPVLHTFSDGEQEDHKLDTKDTTAEVYDEENGEEDVDQNADNIDIHPAFALPSDTPKHASSSQHQSSSFQANARIVKVGNIDMKVAIAFDYMRVKIGEIIELEKFNEALNELLLADREDDVTVINGNGKKTSEDEQAGQSQKISKKGKMARRNN